mgnify:CR=1 FL=1
MVAAQSLQQLGVLTRANDEQAIGHGIEGTGVPHLDAGQSVVVFDGVLDAIDHIKGGPFQGLVDQNQTAGREIGG